MRGEGNDVFDPEECECITTRPIESFWATTGLDPRSCGLVAGKASVAVDFKVCEDYLKKRKFAEDMKPLCAAISENGDCKKECAYAFSDDELRPLIPSSLTQKICSVEGAGSYMKLCPAQCKDANECAHEQGIGKNCASDDDCKCKGMFCFDWKTAFGFWLAALHSLQ
eukprot:TRINITY_DN724_c0_g1_i3.p1 TRINITY_DN724_c0_g1~~TRINITY_DN724_c0_g1_i3.p1  ORF type:complete len:168 (-),score=31.74 TRINITY_DN724_c0_g1_i3:210-713(-)